MGGSFRGWGETIWVEVLGCGLRLFGSPGSCRIGNASNEKRAPDVFGKQTRICELYKDDACVSGPTKHSWFDCSGMIYDYHMVELCRNCCARIYARRLVVRDLLQAASCPMFL